MSCLLFARISTRIPYPLGSAWLASLLLSVNAQAMQLERHIIAAAELSGLFHEVARPEESPGVYFQVLSKVLQDTGLNGHYELIVMPLKRAKIGFIQQEYACYSPGLGTFDKQTELPLVKNVLVSHSINQAIVRVVSAPNHPVVDDLNDIRSTDLISMVRGIAMSEQMRRIANKAAQFFLVNSELENISMLQNGRVNYIFMFYPDALFAYQQLGITTHFPYAKSLAPLIINDNLVCHQQFAEDFALINQKIAQYQQNGTLRAILGDYYMIGTEYMQTSDK